MAESDLPSTARARLAHFPVAWFAMTMGLGGLAIAWQEAQEVLDLPFHPAPYLVTFASLVFAVVAVFYLAKTMIHRQAVFAEWRHPIQLNFVPTISIGLILLSMAWLPYNTDFSRLLWLVGSAAQLFLSMYILTRWIHHPKYEISHLNPAWIIPVVGNILVPVAGVHFAPAEISWFFLSFGLMFWPVLTAIIFYRVIFHGSLPERLTPTLFILIAPPAVGFISYVNLTGVVDSFAYILYNCGLVFTLLLFFQARLFARLKFALSWWAYSFPLAAITIATLLLFQHTGSTLYLRLSGILLGITTVVIAGLLKRTLQAVIKQEICVPD